jgi:hypothetical protein
MKPTLQIIKLVFLLLFVCCGNHMAFSQDKPYPGFYDQLNTRLKEDSTSKIKVSAIIISGNKKTKNYIILREMLIKEGDSLIASRLYNSIEQSRNLVYNTNLFLK